MTPNMLVENWSLTGTSIFLRYWSCWYHRLRRLDPVRYSVLYSGLSLAHTTCSESHLLERNRIYWEDKNSTAVSQWHACVLRQRKSMVLPLMNRLTIERAESQLQPLTGMCLLSVSESRWYHCLQRFDLVRYYKSILSHLAGTMFSSTYESRWYHHVLTTIHSILSTDFSTT